MKNIDLHLHPSQKAMLTNNTLPADHIDFNTKIIIFTDEMLGDILDSQSNIKRLQKGDFKLIFWTIYTMEREVISVSRIQEAMRREKDKNLIDVDFLNDVKTATVNYFDYMQKEWKVMKDAVAANPNLKLIGDIDDMDSTKLNVFPALEGAHAFITSIAEVDFVDDAVIDRLRTFINSEPLSYITLTHFTDKELFTHCFGLKLVTKKELNQSNFYPRYLSNKGYSAFGEKFIKSCIEANKAIDIKHVSLQARLNIYKYIKESAPGYTRIMCSHAGVTGLSYSDFLKNFLIMQRENPNLDNSRIFENRGGYIVKLMYRRKDGPLKLSFNPQMINLYDEDIESIIEIGGVIGFSLDQRILGASTALDRISQVLNYHTDYVALEEFIWLCKQIDLRPEEYLGENYMDRLDKSMITTEDLGLEGDTQSRGILEWKKIHTKRVAQTIMHIMDVGLKVIATPWEHIALGSDFDGLIDAVNSCKTSEDVPSLKKRLVKRFKKLKKNGKFPYAVEPKELITKIFEENMISFYQR